MKVYHEDFIIFFLCFFMFCVVVITFNGSLKISFEHFVLITICTLFSSIMLSCMVRSDEHD